MKKSNLNKLLVLVGVFIASINTVWAVTYNPSGVAQQTMQSQQMMHGGSTYQGQVYTPFSGEVPSSQSSPARISGPRRAGEDNGFDPSEFDTPGDAGTQSSDSPIGEPLVMLLFALGFIGIIFIRKRKLNRMTDMKNTTKFIATLALLCTIGVGQMWAEDDTRTIFLDISDCSWYLNNGYTPRIKVYKNNEKTDYYDIGNNGTVATNVYRFEVAKEAKAIEFVRYNNGSYENWSGIIWINDGSSSSACCYQYHNYFKLDNNAATVADANKTSFASSGEYLYFYADNLTTTTNVGFVLGRWNYSAVSAMSLLSNTQKLYYVTGAYFNDAYSYFSIVGTGNPAWSSGSWGTANLSNASDYTAAKYGYKFNNGSTYYATKSSSSKGSAVSIESKSGYSAIPKYTTTLNIKVREATLGDYTGGNASDKPASTIKITGTCLSDNGTTNRSDATWTSSSSCSYESVISGKVTPTYATLDDNWQFDGWYIEGVSQGTGTSFDFYQSSNTTVEARFTRTKYDINLNNHGATTAGATKVLATYGANTNLTSNITVPTKTGYTFGGYYTEEDGAGTQIINASGAWQTNNSLINASGNWNHIGHVTLHAKWTANTYKITFDATTNGGTITNNGSTYAESGARKIDAAYDATVGGTMPTATKNGNYFKGWYTASTGGSCVIDASGVWQNVADYTNASKQWKRASATTLYAQYGAPVISIGFSPENVLPLDTVTITPSFDHDPEGASTLCYVLVTASGQEMQVQPTWVPGTGNAIKFEAPSAPGDYSVDVRLFNAADHSCADRTTGLVSSYLSRATTFTVEEANAVTVKYMCGSVELRPSTTVYATEYRTAASITAPDIAGLSFASWDTSDEHVWLTPGSTSISKTIQVKADAAATVIANYGQGSLFFKDTKDWVVNPETDSVYIYFYSANKWTTSSGNSEGTGSNGTNFISGPFGMSLLDGTDDVYYFNEAKHGTIPTFAAVAFSKERMPNYNFFAGADSDHPCNVVYVNAFDKTNRPMIVPVGGGATWNYDKCRYYAHDLASLLPDWGYDLRGDNDFIGWVPASDAAKHKMKAAKLGDLSFMTDIYFDGAYDNKEWKVYNGNEGYGREDNQKLTQTSPTSGVLTNHNDGWNMKIQTNVPGAYTFKLTFGTECTDGGTDAFSGAAATNGLMKHMTVTVLYPVNKGDYRLFHSTKKHPGDVIRKRGNCKDTVSMYVGTGQSLDIKMQTCTAVAAGSVTWGSPVALTYADGVNFATILSAGGSGVYNFIVEQDANGVPTIIAVEKYAGNYYVRTDCTNSYKKNYKDVADACKMTYSEYSMSSALAANKQYSHYYVKDLHGSGGSPIDIRFTVATDYSESITDTVTTGITTPTSDPHYDFYGSASLNRVANVRFSYNEATNEIWRAYTEGPTNNNYMVLRTDGAKVYATSSAESPTSTYKFADMGNWVYQVDVYATAPTYVKLTAEMHNSGGTGNTQYLKGNTYDSDYDEDDAVILLGGTAVKQHMRIVYDFKTDRMVTSWIPNGAVSGNVGINADVMLIRNGQDETQQITFAAGDANKLTDVKTVYGVMEIDSSYVNNVVLSRYARSLYWISFPFDVNVRDIFGFGTYGKHWILEYYDGMGRAKYGWWADSEPNWKYITPSMKDTFVLKANTGYVLALSLNRMADGCTDVWVKDVNTVYLYFPSATELGTIQNVASLTMPLSQTGYKCEIDRTGNNGADINKNRKIADSYWHCIGVPSFAQNSLSGTATSSTWASNIPFVYEWSPITNRLYVNTSGSFTFKPMHAYLVQYDGTSITWTNVSNKPSIVSRRKVEGAEADFYEWNLNLMQGTEELDHTYVRMTADENATDGFDFGQDLTKEISTGANIYTFSTYVPVAGNCIPLDLNTTKTVQVGVKIATDGDYTFALPEGIEGVGVVLIDNIAGKRTNLALTDYTVNLTAGTYDERFYLEISPIVQSPTGIEQTSSDSKDGVRKVMVDGILYIVKDGRIYDATGTRVQ